MSPGLAWYYNRDADLDLAMPLLVMALEGDPPYRDVCDLIIQAHIQGREMEEAARLGQWAIEERGCPPNGLIREHYAVALAATGQWEEAARVAMARPGGPQGPLGDHFDLSGGPLGSFLASQGRS